MKLPRDLSGIQIINSLVKIGYISIRQTGSHVRLAKGNMRITIPVHGDVKPGTLKQTIRDLIIQLGLSENDVIKLLTEKKKR